MASFFPPQGAAGVTTGGDYTLGDVTADALILDQANADVRLLRSAANQIKFDDGAGGNAGLTGYAMLPTSHIYLNSNAARWTATTFQLGSTAAIQWADSTNVTSTKDVGLARNAAGVLEVTDGSTGNGTLLVGDGAASAPAYSFSDGNTGIYLGGGGVAFADGGVGTFVITSIGANECQISGPSGRGGWRVSAPSNGDHDAWLYQLTASANAQLSFKICRDYVTLPAAGSYTTSGFFPAGARIEAVAVYVVTPITGATSFDVGDGTDVDRWGATIGLASGTETTSASYTADPGGWATASGTEVTLTANGGNFTGGLVDVVGFYTVIE